MHLQASACQTDANAYFMFMVILNMQPPVANINMQIECLSMPGMHVRLDLIAQKLGMHANGWW